MANPVPAVLLDRFNRIARALGVQPLDQLDRPDEAGMDGTWLLRAVNSVLPEEYRGATVITGYGIGVRSDIADIVCEQLAKNGKPIRSEHGRTYMGPCSDLCGVLRAAI